MNLFLVEKGNRRTGGSLFSGWSVSSSNKRRSCAGTDIEGKQGARFATPMYRNKILYFNRKMKYGKAGFKEGIAYELRISLESS
ncbi:MAG: hypothetical protein D3924_18500 [Candidatus Electrothrix sp. AR4]|nr:hypothetical protein [Candidatus Electrothrix sp. AR4]